MNALYFILVGACQLVQLDVKSKGARHPPRPFTYTMIFAKRQ
jgi:hypothetical protein